MAAQRRPDRQILKGVALALASVMLASLSATAALAALRTTQVAPVVGGIAAEPLFVGHGVGVVATDPFGPGCPRLFATTDFMHWRDISPPQPRTPVPCPCVWQSASFVSPAVGWVLGRDGGNVTTVLFHTTDGGRTWVGQPGSTTGSNGGLQVIGFTSTRDGWRQQFATGSNAPFLL